MSNKVEASPFINTIPSQEIKENLYNIPFSFNRIANKLGEKPVKQFGFWESDESFHKRYNEWVEEEKNVLFSGWTCKDMLHYQELRNIEDNIVITFEFNSYIVNYFKKEYIFPFHPETIDDFLNDLKRIGIKLYWSDGVISKFGKENITSNKKITDYYKIIKDINESGFKSRE